ncbi:MAG: RnfABCDGE type electron transport complex subunit C [Spirochaetia bacterium]|nr:RnfABCDGE type electron transport complex subunit C [Spirochaetia bacterium]
MKRLRNFRTGGLAIAGAPVRLTEEARNAYLPAIATIPLRQHLGPAARCVVKSGDRVEEGQAIGRAEGRDSADVHSPVPGVVRRVSRVRLAGGLECEAVEIALSGAFTRLGKPKRLSPWRSMPRHEIVRTIRERGLVRASDGRPLADALSVFEDEGPCELVVITAVTGEPRNPIEALTLSRRREAVIEGFEMLCRVLSPLSALAVFDAEDLGLAASWDGAKGAEGPPIQAYSVPRRYPQHLPGQLAAALAEAKVTAAATRTFFIQPSLLAEVYEAVAEGKPSLERCVLVAGGAVKTPSVLKVRIGTSIGALFEECGGFRIPPQRVVLNGALDGLACADLDVPVTKTTDMVLALTAEETRTRPERACIRCGACVDACPEGLDPMRLHKLYGSRRLSEMPAAGLSDCTLCGACAYACPSRIPLAQSFSIARARSPEASR